jgi:hypothetical protein
MTRIAQRFVHATFYDRRAAFAAAFPDMDGSSSRSQDAPR